MTRDSHETISTTEYIQQRWDRLQMLVGTGTAAAKAISEVGSFGKNLKTHSVWPQPYCSRSVVGVALDGWKMWNAAALSQ